MKKQLINCLLNYHYDFFITLSFDYSVKRKQVEDTIEKINGHYLIDYCCWSIEKSQLNNYHVHCIVKTTNPIKSLSESSKTNGSDERIRLQKCLRSSLLYLDLKEDLSGDGNGKLTVGRLYRVFQRYGNTEFRLFDNRRKLECIEYITKYYNINPENLILHNFKSQN